MRKRVKALALLRQVGERGCHSGLKLGCRFGVIAPSNLVFASGENECLFGSKTPVFRGFPHLLLGILYSETADFVPFLVLACISSISRSCTAEKDGSISGGTFVAHRLGRMSPHRFLLNTNRLPLKMRATSPHLFMFQYPSLSSMIRLHCMHPAPIGVEKCLLVSICVDSWSLVWIPVDSRLLRSILGDNCRLRVFSCFTSARHGAICTAV